MFRCPSTTPGSVSTSTSSSAAFWISAKRRTLGLGEFDVVDRLGGQTFDRGLDLVLGEPEVAWRPVVELHRQLPHRVIAPRIDVRENPFDRGPHAFIALGGDVGIDTGFDCLDHTRVRKRRVCNVLPMQMTHNSRPRRRGARGDVPSQRKERLARAGASGLKRDADTPRDGAARAAKARGRPEASSKRATANDGQPASIAASETFC